jgi:hypothetical protein
MDLEDGKLICEKCKFEIPIPVCSECKKPLDLEIKKNK